MRKIIIFLVLVGIVIGLVGYKSQSSSKRDVDNPSPNDSLIAWQEQHKDKKVEAVLWREADVNADGDKDTVLIYKNESKKCFLTVILVQGRGFTFLPPVPAPVENQRIQFKDIDNKAPLEFIVSGSKGANTGYAIFRIEEGKVNDLFGQDMDRCC